MPDKENKILTVTQLNEYIKFLLDSSPVLSDIYIKGEISNFTNHYRTGHLYFTLKDEGGLLKTVMFRSSAEKLKFMPENGMRVIVHGRVAVFIRDGQYQLYADSIEPDGIGALYIAYEQLRKRLEAEGLFREDRKRLLPKIPLRIGIITSPTGAAIRDIINITGRRFPMAEIVLFPSLVQGEGAAAQMIAGLDYFNKTGRVDLVIIGRGGGSIEDLWAFNNEALARAVKNSKIPIISAIGHETDFTICDFVADRRAPTPSAAAEIAVPDAQELKRKINNIIGRLESLLSQNITIRRQRLRQAADRRVLTSPAAVIDDKRMIVLSIERRLESGIKLILSGKKNDFIQYTSKLEALNPMSIIIRGYSAVFRDDGTLIKSIKQISLGEQFYFKTFDGEISGEVTEIREKLLNE
ncbi:MAG: exodeoxyribonuclease VII large subunit [Eubacteriales bacterium]|nr:exodeoxyribonuclease VII large subunit [Eubacteriales bacterium]